MRILVLGAAALLLAVVGCERVVGVDNLKIVHQAEGASGAAGSGAGGSANCTAEGQDTCSACIVQKCCDSALPCSQDTSCASCLGASPSPGCDVEGQKYKTYLSCAQEKCPECFNP